MDESSRVLSVSVLYLAGARWLLLRGQSARIQASLKAYSGGFPWVEPVSCKVQTVGGIQDVWGMCAKSRGIEFVRMLVALELYEILREEVVGGAVGVVRGGFPRGGAQRSKSGDCVMSSPSQPRWCARAYTERMGPSQRSNGFGKLGFYHKVGGITSWELVIRFYNTVWCISGVYKL
ncbi:hypothetical protein DFH09DRAFT_1078761 [Mycena vulgaris]|nr:hypothetical protein DFH09DRAFT_1078761 [Mycena vulgaris]